VILGGPERLEAADFALVQAPEDARTAAVPNAPVPGADAPAAPADSLRLDERERATIEAALHSAQGNLSQAARLLGVSRAALYRRLEKHGL
jgi:transcriptional regulator of acetoin/glycerol metabolism